MKKRVLNVVYGFDYGGIRAFIMNTLDYLDRNKFNVDIYAFGTDESPFTEKVLELGAEIYFEPENNVRRISRFVNQLKNFIHEHGPYDIVHAHCNLINAWVLLAAKSAGVPVRLSHSHSSCHFSGSFIQNCYSYLRRFLIDRYATEKLACGKLAGESMYGKKNGFIEIKNGIPVDKYLLCKGGPEKRMQLGIPENARLYVNISRLDLNKNHLFVLDVFDVIAEHDSDAYLLIGGGDTVIESSRIEVEDRIRRSPYEDRVILVGPQNDMPSIYDMSDCWIYPSQHEGLPFAPIELQASGVPCVVSDTITKEIDLGLGLVEYLSLDDDLHIWERTAASMQKTCVSKDRIRQAFLRSGLDINESVHILEKTYSAIVDK